LHLFSFPLHVLAVDICGAHRSALLHVVSVSGFPGGAAEEDAEPLLESRLRRKLLDLDPTGLASRSQATPTLQMDTYVHHVAL
jgi:hypothetical protein